MINLKVNLKGKNNTEVATDIRQFYCKTYWIFSKDFCSQSVEYEHLLGDDIIVYDGLAYDKKFESIYVSVSQPFFAPRTPWQ